MFISTAPKAENRLFEVPSGRRHSVGLGLSSRDSASAVTLRAPWRCAGTNIIANLSAVETILESCGTEIENVSPHPPPHPTPTSPTPQPHSELKGLS